MSYQVYTDNMFFMEKGIKILVEKLLQDQDGKLSGGFATVKGGFRELTTTVNSLSCTNSSSSCSTNPPQCMNTVACAG